MPQYVAQTETMWGGRYLHSFQAAMLELRNIQEEVVVLAAPTGTGKSYAFPLPVVSDKKLSPLANPTCLIISPTNALVEDLKRQYAAQFPELSGKVETLNAKKLDELGAHGTKRWKQILNIVKGNNVVITNPDLLNWAMTGGYAFHKNQEPVTSLLAVVRYFVFDEYHLYDEEQVAIVLSWMILQKHQALAANPNVKFVFASATPQMELLKLLEGFGFSIKIFPEVILSEKPERGRQIHGELKVMFKQTPDPNTAVCEYLTANVRRLRTWFDAGKKVLAMFDDMASIRQARPVIERNFPDYNLAEESGYFTKSGYQDDTPNANLIIGTNKVEVGVNLDVQVCIMPKGRRLSNFIQRFGRVARGEESGVVVVMVSAGDLENLRKEHFGQELTTYDKFIESCRKARLADENSFYAERVPAFLGAYFFIIQRGLKNFDVKTVFKQNFHLQNFEANTRLMYGVLSGLNQAILYELKAINDQTKGYNPQLKHMRDWWLNFLQTFKYFRGNKPSIKFKDLDFHDPDFIQNYSLEWVLKNRYVIGKSSFNGEQVLEVSGFRAEKADLQFVVETFPFGNLNSGSRYLPQYMRFKLTKRLDEIINQLQSNYCRRQDDFSKKVCETLGNIKKLKLIFSEKRLLISGIEVESNFL